MDQKTIRKALLALHILSLLLAAAIAVCRANERMQRLLLGALVLCVLADIRLLIPYFRRNQEMESNLSRFQAELQQQMLYSNEDKLNALQSQINPHFLYNTLETIREMALEHGEVELSRIISSLSLMFRYSMDFSNTVVPLEHELGQIQRYMKLQQLRFPDRFTLNLIRECDEEDIKQVMIPKFTIQPLVENAVKHGFHSMRKGCVLNIRLTALDGGFKIAVEDNGKGIEPESVKAMNHIIRCGRISRSEDSPHNGIGLHNVYSRLLLYFGEQSSVYVWSSLGVGTIVTIDFPKKKND